MNIGILTSGGDCPGLNAVLRAVVLSANHKGHSVYGFYDGFEGLIHADYVQLMTEMVMGIENKGGTILGTTNKGHFGTIGVLEEPDPESIAALEQIKTCVASLNLEALIVIGGDGSLRIANWIGNQAGINIIGVPKTIDNDILHNEVSVGYNTAVATATDAVNKIQDTGASHSRVMLIELMGRTAGWLTLETAIAAGASVVLIPEIPFSYQNVLKYVQAHNSSRGATCTILVAEGASEKGAETSKHVASKELADLLQANQIDARLTVLGHIQRGGSPTVFDIVLGSKLGAKAVELIEQNVRGSALMVQNSRIVQVPIEELNVPPRLVPQDDDLVMTARALGIYFGD